MRPHPDNFCGNDLCAENTGLFGINFQISLASSGISWPLMTPCLLKKSLNQHIENNHGFLSWTRYWIWCYKSQFNLEVLLFECNWIDLNIILKDSAASELSNLYFSLDAYFSRKSIMIQNNPPVAHHLALDRLTWPEILGFTFLKPGNLTFWTG